MRHAQPPIDSAMVSALYGQLCAHHQTELRSLAQQMHAPAPFTGPGTCTWGRPMDGVILGAGDPPCDSVASAASPYGGLCEEHAMEMRLRLVLLPLQTAGDDDD